ncbi:MAG: hypothetical protein NDJ90_06065 [Oligoflexia bacterium]|nr:hypothetical protein [Oligoflexia bacterium]
MKTRLVALLLGALILLSVLLYDPFRAENTSGDTISNRYWPVAILEHHTYTLNPFKEDLQGVAYAAIFQPNGEWHPRSFLGMALFSVPFYAVADLFIDNWSHATIGQVSRWNGMFLAILASVTLFLFLLKVARPGAAFVSTLVFAFGTWHWSLGAQGLSNQVASVLVLTLSLHVLHSLCTERSHGRLDWSSAALGVLMGLIVITRPQDIYLMAPMILALRRLRQWAIFAACASVLVVPVVLANIALFSSPLGFGGLLMRASEAAGEKLSIYQLNFIPALTGLTLSPNRGAIVFLPLLLLLPWLWRILLPGLPLRSILMSLLELRWPRLSAERSFGLPASFWQLSGLGALLYFTLLCFVEFWHSTWSYGSRYLYDLLPLIWPALTLGFEDLWKAAEGRRCALPRFARVALVVFSLQGIAIHALGHRNFDIYVWNFKKVPTDAQVWDFRDWMIAEVWRAGPNTERWSDPLTRLRHYGF